MLWLQKGVLLGFLGGYLRGLEHNGTDSKKDRATYVLLGLFSEQIMEEGGIVLLSKILFFTR